MLINSFKYLIHRKSSVSDDLSRAIQNMLAAEISIVSIVTGLFLWFGMTQILLWRFLGAFSAPTFLLATLVIFSVAALARRSLQHCAVSAIPVRRLIFCLAVSFVLLVLGGEGRFFYANVDWQVRDAVLRDMSINPWPFVYTARETPDMLRAGIGMYLAPSLAYKLAGPAAGDYAMLAQNAFILACILGIGSTLFDDARARLIGLVVLVAFSGMDVIGQILVKDHLADHLEWWSVIQYSSHITTLFWTPHYALAGWLLAALFMLHQQGKAPLGVLYAFAPMTALWSPLTMLGILPFAAVAGFVAFARRRIRVDDAIITGGAILLCAPTLLYLGAAGSSVGARFYPVDPQYYAPFQLLETAPFLLPLSFARNRRFGMWTFFAIACLLLLAPYIQIGDSIDFMMRATIPAFVILAVLTADAISGRSTVTNPMRSFLIGALVIGSITGLSEIRRALTFPTSPRTACSLFKAWDHHFANYPKDSHLAPLDTVPAIIRPSDPARVSAAEPGNCWTGEWREPSGI